MLETNLRDQCKLDLAKPVLVGVSGGPDSLCLLDILRTAGYQVLLAHFNHKLRHESDLEASTVEALARTLGLPFLTDFADVRHYADTESLSVEEAARILRYRFLFNSARKYAAQAVAVGHTADDQVETVLMHFLRGAGLAGLKGMEARTILPVFDPLIPLIRPLLGLWRADTEAYCREHKLHPNFDASNEDQFFFRNRLRHTLIPELEKYNPRFKETLIHTSETLLGDYSSLQEVLEDIWNDVVIESGGGWVTFDQSKMAKLSTGFRRNLIRRAAESLRPESRDFGFDAPERAAAFVENPTGKKIDFVNGLYLFDESGKIYLATYEADLPTADWPQIHSLTSVVKRQTDLGNGWKLTSENCLITTDHWSQNTDKWMAWLDADFVGDSRKSAGKLNVRARQNGDRFQPLGMEDASIKLSDFFVNVKLPKRARAKWPLICVGEVIVWIPGFQLAHPFRVKEKTRRAIRLRLEKK